MSSPVEIGAGKQELGRVERRHDANRYQPVFGRIWQAAKENAIYYAEDCSGGSDTKRGREDRGQGKDRIASKAPDTVAQV